MSVCDFAQMAITVLADAAGTHTADIRRESASALGKFAGDMDYPDAVELREAGMIAPLISILAQVSGAPESAGRRSHRAPANHPCPGHHPSLHSAPPPLPPRPIRPTRTVSRT